MVDDSGFESIR